MYTNLETWDTVRAITTVFQEMIYRWDTVRAIASKYYCYSTTRQETFYRVPYLYTGVLNMFLPRDLNSLQLKYIFRG